MNAVELNKEIVKIAAEVLPGYKISFSDDHYALVLVVRDEEGVMPMKKLYDLMKRVQYVLRTNNYDVSNREVHYGENNACVYWNR